MCRISSRPAAAGEQRPTSTWNRWTTSFCRCESVSMSQLTAGSHRLPDGQAPHESRFRGTPGGAWSFPRARCRVPVHHRAPSVAGSSLGPPGGLALGPLSQGPCVPLPASFPSPEAGSAGTTSFTGAYTTVMPGATAGDGSPIVMSHGPGRPGPVGSRTRTSDARSPTNAARSGDKQQTRSAHCSSLRSPSQGRAAGMRQQLLLTDLS
jgi:hypothetical protein